MWSISFVIIKFLCCEDGYGVFYVKVYYKMLKFYFKKVFLINWCIGMCFYYKLNVFGIKIMFKIFSIIR